MSNGFNDIDSNQLTTPEFTVIAAENFLWLDLYVSLEAEHAVRLDIYIVNELNHRIPDRLYSSNLDEHESMRVCGCYNVFCLLCQ